jgi:hypothetical protein
MGLIFGGDFATMGEGYRDCLFSSYYKETTI